MDIYFRKPDLDRDLNSLYQMMNDDDQFLFSTRIRCNTERAFFSWIVDRLQKDFHDFYVVTVSEKADDIIGFAYDYDFSLEDGHCKICVYVKKEYRNIGIGGVAAVSFIEKLFKKYPLRKIYSTVYSYNTQSLQSNLKYGFEEEGVLKKYKYYNGKFHNIHILSITKEKFGLNML